MPANLLPEKNVRQAAGYMRGIIEHLLRDIEAGSYPQPPESNWYYKYFDTHMKHVTRMFNGEDIKDILESEKEAFTITKAKETINVVAIGFGHNLEDKQ